VDGRSRSHDGGACAEDACFATKPALAARMIEQALAAQVPFAWVAADSVYGVGALETVLRRAGKGYVLGVSSDHCVQSWRKPQAIAGSAETVAQSLAPADWLRLSAGEGTKGARLHDWAYCWPTSTPPNTTRSGPGPGRAAC
jgi:SRSO17 transposase